MSRYQTTNFHSDLILARWSEWDPRELVLQHLKDLWRLVAAHGAPLRSP